MRVRDIEMDLEDYFSYRNVAEFGEVVEYLRKNNIVYDDEMLYDALNELESDGSIAILNPEDDIFTIRYLDSED